MIRKFFVALISAFSLYSSAYAAPVTCTAITGASRSVSCTCTSSPCDAILSSGGSATAAPTGVSNGGLRLGDLPSVVITGVDLWACPAAGQTLSNTFTFDAYVYDPAAGWAKFGSYTTGVTAVADQCVVLKADSPGKGIPIISKREGWLIVVPSGTSATAITVKILASGATRPL